MYLEGKKLIKILPYFPLILGLGGFLATFVYYKKFGINIIGYVELSEIIFLFSKDLMHYGFGITILYFILFLIRPTADMETTSQQITLAQNQSSFISRLEGYYTAHKPFYVLAITMLVLSTTILLIFERPPRTMLSFMLISVWAPLILGILKDEFERKYRINFNKAVDTTYINVTYSVALFYIVLYLYTLINYEITMTGVVYEGSTFSFNDNREITCDSNHIIIGQTKNHLFYFNKLQNVVTAFNRDDINEVRIKPNNFNKRLLISNF